MLHQWEGLPCYQLVPMGLNELIGEMKPIRLQFKKKKKGFLWPLYGNMVRQATKKVSFDSGVSFQACVKLKRPEIFYRGNILIAPFIGYVVIFL